MAPVNTDERPHFVYEIVDGEGAILYLGRSCEPYVRLRAFRRKHPELRVTQRLVFGPSTIEEACQEELRRLRERKPPFNKYVSSSRSNYGKKKSEESKRRVSEALKGRPLSAEHRSKLWATRSREFRPGTPPTPEARIRISETLKQFFSDPKNRAAASARTKAGMARRKAAGLPIGKGVTKARREAGLEC